MEASGKRTLTDVKITEATNDEARYKAKDRSVPWTTHLSMVVALIAGVLFSVAHHLYYQTYDKEIVQSKEQQLWILRIGTGLSYLAKISFSVAAGSAYIQQLWLTSKAGPSTLRNIDSKFGVLGNAFEFCNVKAWLGSPLLLVLAAVTWLVPTASIITPGTLTVTSSNRTIVEMLHTPQLDFVNPVYAQTIMSGMGEEGFSFQGPDHAVYRSTLGSVFGENILPLTSHPAFSNSTLKQSASASSSYNLQFQAPGLRCEPASEEFSKGFVQTLESFIRMLGKEVPAFYSYVAWAGQDGYEKVIEKGNDKKSLALKHTDFTIFRANLFPLIVCSLHNVTYHAKFSFESKGQQIEVEKVDDLGKSKNIYDPEWSDDELNTASFKQTLAYQSVMSAFSQLFIASIWVDVQFEHSGGDFENPETIVQATSFGKYIPSDVVSITQWSPKSEETDGFVRNSTLMNDMISTMEELFTNATLSLFSNPQFLKSKEETVPSKVEHTYPVNQYSYSPQDLLLAYGLAMLFSAISVSAGYIAIYRNRAPYYNSFSNILRATRDRSLDDLVTTERGQSAGKGRTSKEVKQAKLILREYGFEIVKKEDSSVVYNPENMDSESMLSQDQHQEMLEEDRNSENTSCRPPTLSEVEIEEGDFLMESNLHEDSENDNRHDET